MGDFQRERNNFISYLRDQRNLSSKTVLNYLVDLDHYLAFLGEQGVSDLFSVTTAQLRGYLSSLYASGLARSTISRRLSCLRTFYKHLCQEEKIPVNPLTLIHTPKGVKKLPQFLHQNEVKALLAAASGNKPLELRDRAMLELLYGDGLRVGELVALRMGDVNFALQSLLVQGKGRKERMMPLGSYAAEAIRRYLLSGRRLLIRSRRQSPHDQLFVNWRGERLTTRGAYRIITGYLRRIAPARHLSPHALRHTFATQLLEGGADLRSVQELMGHARMSSTQIYTHVSGERIRKIYRQAHPRARFQD